jgi:hypothetical protein
MARRWIRAELWLINASLRKVNDENPKREKHEGRKKYGDNN